MDTDFLGQGQNGEDEREKKRGYKASGTEEYDRDMGQGSHVTVNKQEKSGNIIPTAGI